MWICEVNTWLNEQCQEVSKTAVRKKESRLLQENQQMEEEQLQVHDDPD